MSRAATHCPTHQLLCATLQGTCAQLGLLLQQSPPSQGPQQAWLPGHLAAATSLASVLQLPHHGSNSTSRTQLSPLSARRPWLQQQPSSSASFLQIQQAHTSAAGSTKSRASRSKLGRTHAPLFSHPGSSSSSSRSAAAAVECSDDENEWQQGETASSPTDLLHPQTWYPAARAMAPRSLVAHLGPTNSGKTHAALAALAAAPSGVFCGPLRLLACEVADRLNSMGVPCNLVTGQEVRRVKGARHTACTVEMADLATRVDVAVLDEVQMLGDRGRGWSWTRVLLGLPACQLHLCGDPAAAGLLEQLAAECGDTLEVKRYRRLAPLVVQPEALGGLDQIQDGDCVVAFGRKTLHRLRKTILQHMVPGSTGQPDTPLYSSSDPSSASSDDEDFTTAEQGGWYSNSCSSSDDERACGRDSSSQRQQQQQDDNSAQEAAARAFQGVGMLYGALPPESRRTQAALFNARGDVWPRTSVLVASDAVGMGLNLNIRRIVFTTLHKYDGVETRPLSASEVKQIAGRAGRYASGHAEGYVCVLNPEDLPWLREALATATPHITQACLLPRFEQLEQFALQHEAAQQRRDDLGRQRQRPLTFHKLLKTFVSQSQLSGAYFLADISNMLQLAKLLRHLEPYLDLSDMYTCCISPASADDGPVVKSLLHMVGAYAYDRHVTPDCIPLPVPDQPPRSPAEMKAAEELFRVYDLFLWLYARLGAPGVFRGRRQVLRQHQQVAEFIDVALKRMGGLPSSREGSHAVMQC